MHIELYRLDLEGTCGQSYELLVRPRGEYPVIYQTVMHIKVMLVVNYCFDCWLINVIFNICVDVGYVNVYTRRSNTIGIVSI